MQLRLYSFVNFYLSSIQQGVQTGHAAVDLVRKYAVYNSGYLPSAQAENKIDMVAEWADDNKTFIILNGGNLQTMQGIEEIVKSSDLPWVSFHEDEQSLGGMLTAVAVILPEFIFNARPVISRHDEPIQYESSVTELSLKTTYFRFGPTDKFYSIVDLIRNSRLAQ
jgi:hypothetical protein